MLSHRVCVGRSNCAPRHGPGGKFSNPLGRVGDQAATTSNGDRNLRKSCPFTYYLNTQERDYITEIPHLSEVVLCCYGFSMGL